VLRPLEHIGGGRGDERPLARLVRDGPYFSDGVRLFRRVGVVFGSSGPKLLELEDCRTLAVSDYTEEEVTLLGLVPVSAQPVGEGAGAVTGHELVPAGSDRRG